MLDVSMLIQTSASLGNSDIGPFAPALRMELAMSFVALAAARVVSQACARLASDPTTRPTLNPSEAR